MTEFASNQNSPAEQRALERLIVDTFDAVDVTPRGLGGAEPGPSPDTGGHAPVPPEDLDEPARPNWEQNMLWDAA